MTKTIKLKASNGDSIVTDDLGEAIIWRAIKKSQGLRVWRVR